MKERINMSNPSSHQGFLFLLSGGFQYVLDVAIFSVLILLVSNTLLANASSKFTVGLAGFLINGLWVFKTLRNMPLSGIFFSFIKFLFFLLFMISLSIFLVSLYTGQSYFLTVLTKIVSEIFLAMLSFIIQKFFVYRSGTHCQQATIK